MHKSPRVLSIQSHVVSGYVGSKSAIFPLQVLGFEVDIINSVQFSNSGQYPVFKGQVLSDQDLAELMDGLSENKLDLEYTHLLTGYIRSSSFLLQIAKVVKHLKSINENLIYVCDPVMGDNGQMYVPKDLLPIYQQTIIPLADILVPNQYEAELLTDISINSIDDAWRAIEKLHLKGCKTVVLSSTELGNEDSLIAFASTINGDRKKLSITIPKFPLTFGGTGDLFAALILAWLHKSKDLQVALERTVATLQAVLARTNSFALEHGSEIRKNRELKLIQSKADIENPSVKLHVKVHNC